MTEIRAKDKIFLAVVVPAALLAAYWYGWRDGAGRLAAELEDRRGRLVAEEDFPREKRLAERELAEATAELKAEQDIPMPQTAVKADPKAPPAERERIVIQVLRESGLAVVGSAAAKTGNRSDDVRASRGGELLKATGARPSPIRRAYTVDGLYPDVAKALRRFVDEKTAVIPDSVQMRASGKNRWTMEIWL